MFCVSQKNATPAVAFKSASQTTANGHCVMNPAATSSAEILRNSRAPLKFPVRPNTGQFILLHVHRSTCVQLGANASLTCQKHKMKFTLTQTFRGEKTRCSRWNFERTRMVDMRCTRAITSKFRKKKRCPFQLLQRFSRFKPAPHV